MPTELTHTNARNLRPGDIHVSGLVGVPYGRITRAAFNPGGQDFVRVTIEPFDAPNTFRSAFIRPDKPIQIFRNDDAPESEALRELRGLAAYVATRIATLERRQS